MNPRIEEVWTAARLSLLKEHAGRVAAVSADRVLGVADTGDGAAVIGIGELGSLDFELRWIEEPRVYDLPLCIVLGK